MKKRRISSYRYESIALIICAVLFLCTAEPGFAQDSPFNNPDYREARKLFDTDQIDQAKTRFELLAEVHCGNSGDSEMCFEAKLILSSIAGRNGNLEAKKALARELSDYVRKHLGNGLYYRARLAKLRLYHSINQTEPEVTDEWVNELQEIIAAEEDNQLTLAEAHNAIGYYEDMLGNYKVAIQHYNTAIEMAKSTDSFEIADRLLLQAHNNLGISYKNMGRLDEAKKEYEVSLDIIHRLYPNRNRSEAGAFINIGSIHYSKGDYGLAAEYFQRSVEIYRSLTGNFSGDLGASLNNLAASYYMLADYDKSAESFEEAQRLKEENLGYDHPETAIGYSNLAAIHILNSDFEAARENIERSITVREAAYGPDHPNLIDPKIRLGNLYNRHLEQYEEARIHYRSALDIVNDRLGETHPDVTDIYLQIGKTYIEDKNYSNAERYLDRAIINLYGTYDFDQALDLDRAISNPLTFVLALSYKARLLKERNEEVSVNDYQHALMALEWAADLVDFLQQSFKNEASKLQLVESNYSIYTDAVEIIAALYEETGSTDFKDRIFEIIEKSRSRVALELIQKVNARNYAGVPMEILDEESSINNQITRLQQNLFQEENEGLEKKSARISALRDSIFQYKRTLEDFTDKLEDEFPSYYSLKYDQSVIDRQEAQLLLEDDEVALSYVLGTDRAFVLVLSKDDVNLVELGKTSDINSRVLELKKQVLTRNTDAYKKTAYELYEQLIQPAEAYLQGNRLLVMADQKLHYLPFEMLLTELPDHEQFQKFPYLLRDYTISYIPSVTLLSEMKSRASENPRNLLAVAPFSNDIEPEAREFMDHRYADNVSPLLLTRYETSAISEQFASRRSWNEYLRPQQTRLLMGNEATYSRFADTNFTDYNFIHFATHAFINEESPEYSGILLYPEEGNSGVAYVGDIYNMEFNADLVVLGACQTGLGSIYKGEGLIGFTRAFIYAGASNLAVSMWKVSDQPTAYLMIDFYDLIRQGYNYSEALRQAKLNLIEKPQFSEPVNWAAFTLTGR